MNPKPRRRPTPADWGLGMTVCIATMCEMGRKIVAVSDHMLSTENFGADNVACKSEPIHRNWYALWAGDVSYIPLILDLAKQIIAGMQLEPSQHDVANAIAQANNCILDREIFNTLVSKHGYNDMDSFRKTGKADLTAAIFNPIHREIKALNLGAYFLVCGFDEQGDGHIFTFEPKGQLQSCDAAGFSAIGAGEHNALSSIFFHAKKNGFNQNSPVDDAVYVACEAKFMAESAAGVGERTFGTIFEYNQRIRYLDVDEVGTFRSKWLAEYSPKISDEGKRLIMETLHKPID